MTPEQSDLVPSLLDPLLEDFLYWYAQSVQLLEGASLGFMTVEEQQQLTSEIQAAEREVRSAQSLLRATGVGIDPNMMAQWHRLVVKGWQVAQQHRLNSRP